MKRNNSLGLEDDKIFAAFKNSGISVPDAVNNGAINAIVTGSSGLSPEVAAQAFAAVEQYDMQNVVVKLRYMLETPTKLLVLQRSKNLKDKDNQQESLVRSSTTTREGEPKNSYDIVCSNERSLEAGRNDQSESSIGNN